MASQNDPTTPDSTTTGTEHPTLDLSAGGAASGEAASAEKPAPAEKPKRRRATKKAAAPAPTQAVASDADRSDDADADLAAAAAAGGGGGEAPADESPKKPTRKRAAKKSTRKVAKVAEPEDAAEPVVVEPASTEPAAAEPAAEDTPATEPAVDAAEEDDAEDDDPAVPSFGLLFQAPEPARARRRATAPAQAPTERPAVDDETVERDERDERTADAPRAGRGRRRGRSADPTPVTDAPDDAEPARDAGAADTTDADSTEADSTDADTTAADATDAQGSERPDDRSGDDGDGGSRRRRRGGRGRRGRAGSDDDQGGTASDSDGAEGSDQARGSGPASDSESDSDDDGEGASSRRRRRRRRGGASGDGDNEDPPGTVTRVREPRSQRDEPTAVKGSTRLEAKKQRRREGREAGRRRTIITEAEFLARRESVERVMVVRGRGDRTQIGVLEDGVLVEHYVSRETTASMAGNVYLGRVQNVLPSMEAAFVDIGKGRNAVLYAGEVNWDAAGLEGGNSRRIENALSSGDTVLVQVTKDPIGHKGARLTSQVSLPGRYLVYVPEGSMTGISRKLPDTERARLKAILKEVVPDSAGVIVRTAAEGASEEELRADVERLTKAWEKISSKADAARAKKAGGGGSPVLLHGEPDLTVRVIRDVFTEDFTSLVVSGDQAWGEVSQYVEDVAPDLAPRLQRWTAEQDVFAEHRIDEALAKAMDRKVWLPSGGSLVIDRTEAMTVVDVNTGKFVGSGGNLEETVTKNNLEAAEEIVRQLRLRDIGGIIVIDFIDMVLESNRDLVVRRLLECLGRDRTKHQVAEVTSLGLVQMTRKRVGSGLVEVFSEQCEHCAGRGIVVHTEPIERGGSSDSSGGSSSSTRSGRGRRGQAVGSGSSGSGSGSSGGSAAHEEPRVHSGPTAAQIAAAAHAAAMRRPDHAEHVHDDVPTADVPTADVPTEVVVEAPVAEQASDAVVEQADAVVEPLARPVTTPVLEPVVEPVVESPPAAAPRGRRKRGRVVAPAGPPPGAPDEPASQDRPAS